LDADPDFHVDADPDPDPDWHQNNADPKFPSFTHVLTLLVPVLPLYRTMFYLSHQCQSNVSYVFIILDNVLNFLEKSSVYQLFHLLGIDTDPDRPHPDCHVLDADSHPDPAN
jgi:hypothetical protein